MNEPVEGIPDSGWETGGMLYSGLGNESSEVTIPLMCGNDSLEACHCEERSVGQASRLSMTGKPAPDPDPGMPVPPAISSSARWRLLPPLGSGVAMTSSGHAPSTRE